MKNHGTISQPKPHNRRNSQLLTLAINDDCRAKNIRRTTINNILLIELKRVFITRTKCLSDHQIHSKITNNTQHYYIIIMINTTGWRSNLTDKTKTFSTRALCGHQQTDPQTRAYETNMLQKSLYNWTRRYL